MTTIANLRLFATHPHACSYLEDEIATTLFVDPDASINKKVYSQLSEVGFRRSGQHLYRPDCTGCTACIPARIPVALFRANRQQKRCAKQNSDLQLKVINDINAAEYYDLYQHYINVRHIDGDMYPPSRQQYHSFLTSEWGVTRYLEMRLDGKLVAVAVIDLLDNGLSAVYTFFDPDMQHRSLGTYAVLAQIKIALESGLHHVYLGYWIKNCRKMSYKTKFQPLELFQSGFWSQADHFE
ncbi:arginyltransferase [Halioxenophilus sp. WMMB6]|uniref:arginyltransferase n=1 Tax=Halioxenophilus sp. WMMB6 TaxID=3073815 RepID=UPI00295E3DF3|nr:arginyltransferase [Halioxenophilus sp. WMMB6]